MMESPPDPLPSAQPFQVSPNVTIQAPLSRRGTGPGLVLVTSELPSSASAHSLDPPPLQKWAEEGFAIAEIRCNSVGVFADHLQGAIQALEVLPECDDSCKIAVIVYGQPRASPDIALALEQNSTIKCIVVFGDALVFSRPQLLHTTAENETQLGHRAAVKVYRYSEAKSPNFVLPNHGDFLPSAAALSHTRSLAFLKGVLGGPVFDLEAIWDEHCAFEFGSRSVEHTMATMVQEPYVNHIPTMTGGIGREKLSAFYRDHFIFSNPDDTALELLSRSCGMDRIIDEFNFSFTHDKVIDWLLPGIPATFRKVRVPFTSVVNIRGDRLYHEHIAWDQASVLVQLGLLPPWLPFPYSVDGRDPAPGKRFEYRVPAAGVETAMKLQDENSVASNGMFEYGIREVDDV